MIGYWFKKLADALDEEAKEINVRPFERDAAIVVRTIATIAKALRRVAKDA